LSLDALYRRRTLKWQTFGPDVLPAWVAEMDFDVAPPVIQAAVNCAQRGEFGYTYDTGPELGEAFAAFASRRWDWQVDPAKCVTLPDVMRGIDIYLQLFTEPGDGVVVDTPVYFPFLEAIATNGRKLVQNPVVLHDGRYVPDLHGLERAFADGARGYLLCNPHNPTGRVFTVEELTRIVELAQRYGVTIASDEIHAPLTLPGATHVPIASLPGAAQHIVTVTSASKAWNLPGLKCALMVPSTDAQHESVLSLPVRARMGASVVGYEANVAAYTQGEAWLDELVRYLDGNRKLLGTMLAERLPRLGYVPPEATYLAWLDCAALNVEDPAQVFLERGRVALTGGATFGEGGQHHARLNFGTSREILTQVVDRLATSLTLMQ
jgi:cystathionine beta-lyase